MTAPLLEARGLGITLPGHIRAVDGVNLEVAAGGRLGLVGESGSGKSLTAAALIGLPPPGTVLSAETLRWDGRDLLRLGSRARRRLRGREIVLLPQNGGNALNPVRRIGDQLTAILRRIRGLGVQAAAQRAQDALQELGIAEIERCWRAYPHQLSGGQNSRVLLALALACEPRLLIADEPTAALDPIVQVQVIAALQRARERSGMALLLISHDLPLIARCVDELAVMVAGQIVEAGPATLLLQAPRHPYTQALLESRIGARSADGRPPVIAGLPPAVGQRPSGCVFHPRCRLRLAHCFDRVPEDHRVGQHTSRCHLAELALPRVLE